MRNYTRQDEPWQFDIDAYLADAPQRRAEDWRRHILAAPAEKLRVWYDHAGLRTFF